jgi:hypothetical protein
VNLTASAAWHGLKPGSIVKYMMGGTIRMGDGVVMRENDVCLVFRVTKCGYADLCIGLRITRDVWMGGFQKLNHV